jgi:hypothetical protein
MPTTTSNGVSDGACNSPGVQDHVPTASLQPQQAVHSSDTGSQGVGSSNGADDVIPPNMTAVMRDILSFALPVGGMCTASLQTTEQQVPIPPLPITRLAMSMEPHACRL